MSLLPGLRPNMTAYNRLPRVATTRELASD